jgi:hypothetical protein
MERNFDPTVPTNNYTWTTIQLQRCTKTKMLHVQMIVGITVKQISGIVPSYNLDVQLVLAVTWLWQTVNH